MKKMMTAIALSIALPAMAHAQAAPAAKADCCDKMKPGMDCCKDMASKGHDMKGMESMQDMKGMKSMPSGHVMPAGEAPAASAHTNH